VWVGGRGQGFDFSHCPHAETPHLSINSCVHTDSHLPIRSLPTRTQGYHGVSFNEISKLHAMAYSWNGNASYLNTSLNAFNMMVKFDLQVRERTSTVRLWCHICAIAVSFCTLCLFSCLPWSPSTLRSHASATRIRTSRWLQRPLLLLPIGLVLTMEPVCVARLHRCTE
jgi:hypothetical protein